MAETLGVYLLILYIHGFGGSGEGAKATLFRNHYQVGTFIAPSFSYVPALAVKTAQELIQTFISMGEEVHLIGSSMGGFFALYLAQRFDLKAVLINPAIHSHMTLEKYKGRVANFFDGSDFSWEDGHLKMLEAYHLREFKRGNFLLLVQKGDDILDYQEAVSLLSSTTPAGNIIVEEGGSHSFDNISSKFELIDTFFMKA
jgi:uncharacterized protein